MVRLAYLSLRREAPRENLARGPAFNGNLTPVSFAASPSGRSTSKLADTTAKSFLGQRPIQGFFNAIDVKRTLRIVQIATLYARRLVERLTIVGIGKCRIGPNHA
jgi:hypothetical protein